MRIHPRLFSLGGGGVQFGEGGAHSDSLKAQDDNLGVTLFLGTSWQC